jgi:hypothetical protein
MPLFLSLSPLESKAKSLLLTVESYYAGPAKPVLDGTSGFARNVRLLRSMITSMAALAQEIIDDPDFASLDTGLQADVTAVRDSDAVVGSAIDAATDPDAIFGALSSDDKLAATANYVVETSLRDAVKGAMNLEFRTDLP